MIRTSRLLSVGSLLVLAAFGANPAHAAGTTAGTTITNNVSVNYQVGGVTQTASTASNAFIVDRKINLTVVEVGATTSVSPGQTAAVTTFTVTNTSNAVMDFGLSAAQQTTGTVAFHGGTDSFDTSNVKIYSDAALTMQITYIDELAADTSKTVYVVSDVPLGLANGAVAGVVLTAQARDGGTAGSQGAVSVATVGANTAGMDTVFADGAGTTDAANDGKFSAADDYTVSAATLAVTKTSTIISDPVNNTTNPKAIPGAVIEYCIAVANGAGSATATSLGVSDPVPAQETYLAAFGVITNGTVTAGVCNNDGAGAGTYTAATTTVSGALANLAGGATETLRFRATIN